MHSQQITEAKKMTSAAPLSWRRAVKAALSFIEMSIILGVLTVGMTLGMNHYTQYINHQTTEAAADQLERLTEAVSKYTVDHKSELATQAQAAGAAGLFLTTITEAQLKTGEYLNAGDSLINPFGQAYQILVKGSPTSATDQKIMPFIVSDGNSTMIEAGDARKVASAIGGTAGYTTAAEPETIVGTNSLWNFDVSVWGLAPAPERIASAVFYSDGVEQIDVSGLLHRKNEGDPVLNTMETDILMGGNDILGAQLVQSDGVETQAVDVKDAGGTSVTTISAGNIRTTGAVGAKTFQVNAVVNEGASCSVAADGTPLTAADGVSPVEPGTIARNAAGLLLSCQS
ncbi:hypothetical protein PuT2_14615, partial [Pusillimonas sp. T2]|uniref:shufflon system plasmid conjugative transfer pilus tip adhesin PilV n=1 Tax=Pusillimonas sp. T2 TaxID=1548123 RepID=UPI000B8A755D